MYWPLNVAKRLLPPRLPPSAPEAEDEDADLEEPFVHTSAAPPTSHPSHFIALTPSTIHLYSTRPAQCVASLKRTRKSLDDYGRNKKCWWRPGLSGDRGGEIAVETTSSHILLFTITVSEPIQAYSYTASGPSSSKKGLAPSIKSLKATFAAAAGEVIGSWSAGNGELRIGDVQNTGSTSAGGGAALEIRLKLAFKVDAGVSCVTPTISHLIVATTSPPAVQAIPWPDSLQAGQTQTTLLSALPWIHKQKDDSQGDDAEAKPSMYISRIVYSMALDLFVWITTDGRAYVATLERNDPESDSAPWQGRCFHGVSTRPRRRRSSARRREASAVSEDGENDHATKHKDDGHHLDVLPSGSFATSAAVNPQMGLIAIGQADGINSVYILRSQHRAVFSHRLSLREALRSTASHLTCGTVQCQQWTADGLALAIGWQTGWSVWSAWGKLMGHSFAEDFAANKSKNHSDAFMDGVQELFWGPSGTELLVMANERGPSSGKAPRSDRQLFSVPHAKSALAGQHSPDNTRFAFIQLDESLLVYRGSDQPDMSIINPESDVWHHINIPQEYLAMNWPIRYACISNDGLLIAISGRRGLAHYSSSSGRWKQFTSQAEEQSFVVRGGMQWYQHVLVVACQHHDETQLRLYSRDLDLSDERLLYVEELPSTVILTSLFEDSLLVYTSDNTFYHYLIVITQDSITLQLCGSITFEGVVGEPERVRGMSWMIPQSQQRFGDPMEDLTVATIIFLVDGKLVLLRPRKTGQDAEEVAYDMQILGDRIEYYWTHLHGIGTLENSLWGYDGAGIKLWLDALTIEQAEPRRNAKPDINDGDDGDDDDDEGEKDGGGGDPSDVEADADDADELPEYKTIEESLSMPLQFYPLCVVLEKGIIIGVEPEISVRRNLDFTIFRSGTTTHLFLHQLLRYYLEQGRMREAVLCASSYRGLVYFSHALEVLLHAVLEDEADARASASATAADVTSSTSDGSMIVHGADDSSYDVGESLSQSTSADSGMATLSLDRNGFGSSGDGGAAAAEKPKTSSGNEDLLPVVVDFLDHFDESLSVVANCARKTDFVRWSYLFSVVGPAQDLFAKCLAAGDLKTAASYLLVLQNLEPYDQSMRDTARLLRAAVQAEDWPLCQDLLRYTRSMDEEGSALKEVVELAGILEDVSREGSGSGEGDGSSAVGNGHLHAPAAPQAASLWGRRPSSPRRSISATSLVLDAPQEADEDEEERATSMMSAPDSKVADGSPAPRRGGPLRSYSGSFRNASLSAAPPVPQVSVNGRIMPAAVAGEPSPSSPVSPFTASPLFPQRRTSHDGRPGERKTSHGGSNEGATKLGMSMHRVGLRSAEQLFLGGNHIGNNGRRNSSSSSGATGTTPTESGAPRRNGAGPMSRSESAQ